MDIGSAVITALGSGIIVDGTKTEWVIVCVAGQYELGPITVHRVKKGGRFPIPWTETTKESVIEYMLDAYERAFPSSQKQKSELAHRLLLQHLGQEDETMATAKKTPQPIKKEAAAPKKEAATKKDAAPKKEAVAPKKEAAAPKVGRAPTFSTDMKIKILVEGNPKRTTAAERFALYKNGMTVGAYIEAGGSLADVRWDVKQGFISVT